MREHDMASFAKSASFEETGQKVKVEVSLEDCEKKDYRKLVPVVSVLFNEIMADLEA